MNLQPESYDWTCPECDFPNEEEDAPDYGKLLICRACGFEIKAYETEE